MAQNKYLFCSPGESQLILLSHIYYSFIGHVVEWDYFHSPFRGGTYFGCLIFGFGQIEDILGIILVKEFFKKSN